MVIQVLFVTGRLGAVRRMRTRLSMAIYQEIMQHKVAATRQEQLHVELYM